MPLKRPGERNYFCLAGFLGEGGGQAVYRSSSWRVVAAEKSGTSVGDPGAAQPQGRAHPQPAPRPPQVLSLTSRNRQLNPVTEGWQAAEKIPSPVAAPLGGLICLSAMPAARGLRKQITPSPAELARVIYWFSRPGVVHLRAGARPPGINETLLGSPGAATQRWAHPPPGPKAAKSIESRILEWASGSADSVIHPVCRPLRKALPLEPALLGGLVCLWAVGCFRRLRWFSCRLFAQNATGSR
jgi:hypothetical protein